MQALHVGLLEAHVELRAVAREQEARAFLARDQLELGSHRQRVGRAGAHAEAAVDALAEVDVEPRRVDLVVLVALALHLEAVDGADVLARVADDALRRDVEQVATLAVADRDRWLLGILARDRRAAAFAAQVLDEVAARRAQAREERADAVVQAVDPGEDHPVPPVAFCGGREGCASGCAGSGCVRPRIAGCTWPYLLRAARTSKRPSTSGTPHAARWPSTPRSACRWAGNRPYGVPGTVPPETSIVSAR